MDKNQLDAVARIQAALGNMARLEKAVNASLAAAKIGPARLRIQPELGRLFSELDYLLCDHYMEQDKQRLMGGEVAA